MSTTAPPPTERSTGGAARARPSRRSGPVRGQEATTPETATSRGDGLERLRILLAGAMGAILTGYTIMVPAAAVLTVSGGEEVTPDGALATAVPLWLAAQQIPLVLEGRPLGVLPLLPTIAVFVVVMIAAEWSVRRMGGRVRHDAGAVVASQAGAAAAVAVLGGALLPRAMAVAAPWASMVGAGLVAGTAAGVGVLRACGPPAAWRERLQGWPAAGLAGARVGVAGLLLTGALVLLAGLLGHAPAVARSFATIAPDVGAGLGVALLAVAYLPNALLGGMAWALGPGIGVGAAQNGPFGAVDGPLPPFPLFAALPSAPVSAWAVLVVLLPIGTGAAAGVVTSRSLGPAAGRNDRLAAASLAAGVTAVGAGLAASIAGGRLAGGPYDPVTLSGWLVLLAVSLLVGVPAVTVCVGLDRTATGTGRALDVARARRSAREVAGRAGRAAAARATGRAGVPAARGDEPVARRLGRRRPDTDEDHGNGRRTGPGKPGRRDGAEGDAPPSADRTADGPPRRSARKDPRPERKRDEPAAADLPGPDQPGPHQPGPDLPGPDQAGSGAAGSDDDGPGSVSVEEPAPHPETGAGAGSGAEGPDDPPRTVADLVARRERESVDPSPDEN